MAGGTGSRMGTSKKMLLEINGEKIIDRVVRILHSQNFRISLCISENTLFLHEYPEVRIVMGKGSYAEDLSFAVGMCSLPVLVVPADVIFSPEMIENFIEQSISLETGIVTLMVNNKLSGISIFFKNPGNENLPYRNIKIEREDFFNLNFPEDYRRAIEYLEK